jgi:hypothetical protein
MNVAVHGHLLVTKSVPVSPLTWLDATDDAHARNAAGRTLRNRRLVIVRCSIGVFE